MSLVQEWGRIGLSHRAEFIALFTLLVEALHDPELRDDVDDLLAAPARMLTNAGCPHDLSNGIVAALIGLALVTLAPGSFPVAAAIKRFHDSAAVLFEGLAISPEPVVHTTSTHEKK